MEIDKFLTTLDRIVSDALDMPNLQAAETDDSEIEDGFDFSDEGIFEGEDDSDLDLERQQTFLVPDKPVNLRKKLRRDLRIVKNAGYKVGYLGETEGTIIISVACRIALLGLSEEAMQAWGVRPGEYLVLLIRHFSAYRDVQEVIALGNHASTFLQLYVGLCDSYKPSHDAAIHAFQGASQPGSDTPMAQDLPFDNPIRELFIGDSLNKLLAERFLEIVKLRIEHQFSWTGAEYFFHDGQGKILSNRDATSPRYEVLDSWRTPGPALLTPDHMFEAEFILSNISLPLLAMQFTLRHFVKCTEFCLVCHCKTTDDFEALKPYVCSNGLCLFQYMALRLGPSLEYEIRSQPYVVDMLICLAYIRANARRLKDFPAGLGLRVPYLPDPPDTRLAHLPIMSDSPPLCKGTLSITGETLSLLWMDYRERLLVGDWVVIPDAETWEGGVPKVPWHCRVREICSASGHVMLSLPIRGPKQLSARTVLSCIPNPKEVRLAVYDHTLDEIDFTKRQGVIVGLLNNLPSIDEMTQYLGHQSSGRLLASWRDRISPAALDLLRWIVSSNRSCILQDNNNQEHLVGGMDRYIQFRLVQGAPDKEQRFLEAVSTNSEPGKSSYPTIFAWHGSGLENWHSILREGLHFETKAHGRSFGDGVYLSSRFDISLGYTQSYLREASWPQSMLNMKSMISLNEVVNCTSRFVSSSPHYVVKHLDWIQPRYLFVGTTSGDFRKSPSSTVLYQQDPVHPAHGPCGNLVKIPLSAFSSIRRQRLHLQSPSKNETSWIPGDSAENIDDSASVSTAIEDLTILLSEEESDEEMGEQSSEETPSGLNNKVVKKATVHGKDALDEIPATDFAPGSLQVRSLPLLAAPEYATPAATKVLQRRLQEALKLQEKEKSHELGWYIDPNLITTVYQWIVELHSFDPVLPLAKDLRSAKMSSVVLEMRFPSEFPMAPPFVRVIRPRFLAFLQGGGGHVTAGGAMCMELLTNSGWSAVASIESVLLQVRLAITSTDPQPARLDKGLHSRDYGVGEAIQAYRRACMQHHWKIPKDIDAMLW